MSVKTIYTCDKCKKEQDTSEQFWNVGVTANRVKHSLPNYFVSGKSIQVCRSCLELLGLSVQKRPDIEKQPKSPTIEKLIQEIIDRSIEN